MDEPESSHMTSRIPPSNEVLTDRIKVLGHKVEQLETKHAAMESKHTEILVELKVLGSRVGFLAAGIGAATGVASSVVVAVVLKLMN